MAIDVYMSDWDQRFSFLYDGSALVVRYEDLVQDVESVLGRIYRYLDVDPVSTGTQFTYDVRQDYIGDRIDPQREKQLLEMFTPDDKREIRRRCGPVLERYYPEYLDGVPG